LIKKSFQLPPDYPALKALFILDRNVEFELALCRTFGAHFYCDEIPRPHGRGYTMSPLRGSSSLLTKRPEGPAVN
jgi:hypothetical protein